MLLAEEFVLLALDSGGSPARGTMNQPASAVGVTAALVTELAQEGHLDLDDGRIRLTGTAPQNPLLAQALDNIAPYEGKKLKNRLAAIKHAGWSEVVDGMIEQGILGREKEFLRPTRHPVTDVAADEVFLAKIRSAAIGSEPLDARTASLLALAGPCQLLEVVAPNRSDRPAAKRRIAEAAEQVPAAAAVKYVIDSLNAAMVVVASTAATGG